MRVDGYFMSIADRSILSCWGVNGGRAGRPFQVTIDPGGPGERDVDAMADSEFVPAGTLIRIRTTGGGGWGDPLERDPALVARDVRWGKVSSSAAAANYGVMFVGPAHDPVVDSEATVALRSELRAARPGARPFFDRGPGYAVLSGGQAAAEVDWV
jgi:N-methylhydantoinase B